MTEPKWLTVLVEARELVKKGWVQGRGMIVWQGEKNYCAWGAICASNPSSGSRKAARDRLCVAAGTPETLILWNDDPARTKAEVLAAFDTAIHEGRKG